MLQSIKLCKELDTTEQLNWTEKEYVEFSRQEYRSGLSFLSPGIEPGSPVLQADSLPSESPGNVSKKNMAALKVVKEKRLQYILNEKSNSCSEKLGEGLSSCLLWRKNSAKRPRCEKDKSICYKKNTCRKNKIHVKEHTGKLRMSCVP